MADQTHEAHVAEIVRDLERQREANPEGEAAFLAAPEAEVVEQTARWLDAMERKGSLGPRQTAVADALLRYWRKGQDERG